MDVLLQTLVAEWDDDNTLAISLTGSHARGDAMRYSDVDVWRFVKTMPDVLYSLQQHDSFLLSVSYKTFDSLREEMRQPQQALFAVPAVRQMRVLLDKDQCDRTLQHVAHLWGYRVKMLEIDAETSKILKEHEALPLP